MTCLLVRGDARRIPLPDASVDAVIADPPYGTGQWQRGKVGLGKVPKACYSRERWDAWDMQWLAEARRVSRGPVAFFLPNRHIADAIGYAGSIGESWRLLVWCKPDPMPMFTKRVAYGFEPVFLLRDELASGDKDWFEASSPRQNSGSEPRVHPHQKPVATLRWLCRLVAKRGDLILDPFSGSGSTGKAALREGMRYVGVDLTPAYLEMSADRLNGPATPLFDSLLD